MSLNEITVNRPVTIIVIFLMIVGVGLYSCSGIAIDLLPEFTPPVLTVFVVYEGTGPEEMELTITRPLEGVLGSVSGVKTISSTSSEGVSIVTLEFEWGVDIDSATNETRDRLEPIRNILPEEASEPQIFKFDTSQIPVMELQLDGNRTPEDLLEIAEDLVQPRLEQLEGVAQITISGGRERVVRVEIPQNRLEAYQLTLSQVANALNTQNTQVTVGSIAEGTIDYLITSEGEYDSIKEIEDAVIVYRGGTPERAPSAVRLRDIAEVSDGFRDINTLQFVDGQPALLIEVQKQSGANSVEIADKIVRAIERINRLLPPGLTLTVLDDNTEIIRNTINQVGQAALSGAILAVIVLLIFLRNALVTFIISLSIPISVIVTMMFMFFADLTLNIMSLTGLALGVGMLVDNSIVILENIFRYREKGAKPKIAAILGSREMTTAVTASTLTTICVFAPIIAFKGQLEVYGEFFSDLAFTVVIALASSLVVALLLIPALSGLWLKRRVITPLQPEGRLGLGAKLNGLMERLFGGLDSLYKRFLGFVLRHRFLTLAVITLFFVGSLLLIPAVGFEPFPDQGDDSVTVSIAMPVGTKLEITYEILRQFEEIVRAEIPDGRQILVQAGTDASHLGQLTVQLAEFSMRIHETEDVQRKLRGHFDDFPGVAFSFREFGRRPGGSGFGSSPIDVVINSDDYERAFRTAEQIHDLLSDAPEIAEPVVDVESGRPQVDVRLDRNRVYDLRLSVADIGRELRANIDGISGSSYRSGGSEYDILVIGAERDRDQLPDLEKIFVLNNQGERIPVANFASLSYGSGPQDIGRENQRRTIHVTADIATDENGRPYRNVQQIVAQIIRENILVDDELAITYGGDSGEQDDLLGNFLIVLLIAVGLVFGVMASQFESFRDPFIIIFSIPLVLIGVVIIHLIAGEVLSFLGIVGVIMLSGIVVNNGIVLVDYINLLRKRGYSLREACIEAGGSRLRPILMTNITTICGLLPVALYQGENSTLVQPIAMSVVGGLAVGAVMTLTMIPIVYSLVNGRAIRVAEKRAERRANRTERRLERQRRRLASPPVEE